MRTPDEFRSLAATLFASGEPERAEPTIENEEEIIEPAPDLAIAESNLLRDVRLFNARVTEALESAIEQLLCDVACDVLARELQLRPADIERIVDRTLQRFCAEEPLRVRVHPEDVATLKSRIPAIADASLSRGDAILELRDGFVDASLGVRLQAVLRELAP